MSDLSRLPARFRQKIKVEAETGCWIWVGATSSSGYGITNPSGSRRYVVAHRMIYAMLIDPDLPLWPGRQWQGATVLDHVCRVKACVNPDHLEPVSQRENLARAFIREPLIPKDDAIIVVPQTQQSLF